MPLASAIVAASGLGCSWPSEGPLRTLGLPPSEAKLMMPCSSAAGLFVAVGGACDRPGADGLEGRAPSREGPEIAGIIVPIRDAEIEHAMEGRDQKTRPRRQM